MNVGKAFGSNHVLEDVSFDVPKGEILCLLGANGAGKSTLFNIILENIDSDSGEIRKTSKKQKISFCPQHDMGWDHFTVKEHFEFIKAIQDEDKWIPNFDQKIKELTMLSGHWNVIGERLSGGYKRRLTLALALLNNSDLILMDEPTTALDMEIRHKIMKEISSIREQLGTTIMYTTHHLEDAESFSDNIMIMSRGKIILKGSIETLRKQFNLINVKLYNLDSEGELVVERLVKNNLSQECEIKREGRCLNIRMPFNMSAHLIEHIKQLEQVSTEVIVDMKQTSLEDVYVMDGEFDNYNNMEAVGRVDMDQCWQKLLTAERHMSLFRGLKLMLKKSISLSHHRSDNIEA
jgi:ABC-2 type transport system ATP-binding protein